MRILSLALTAALFVTLASPAFVSAQAAGSSSVIQFWYVSGTSIIGGSQVWTYAGTNLTMNSTFSDQDGVRTQEITEFHVHAVVPGRDPFPLANGTNQYPFPQVTVYYDTSQVVQDPKQCVSANNSVGFVCGVPRVDLRHQVLEVRLVRLLEFSDTNGDKGYAGGEPILSQVNLDDRSMQYAIPSLFGLDDSAARVNLPIRHNSSASYGDSSEGWLGQNEAAFGSFDGMGFTLSGSGRVGANCICLAFVLGIASPEAAPLFFGIAIDCVFATPPGFCNICVIACAGAVLTGNGYFAAGCVGCLLVELGLDISACTKRAGG